MGIERILDVTQAGFTSRLCIEQNSELVPGAKLLYIAVALKLPDAGIEMMSGNEVRVKSLENVTEGIVVVGLSFFLFASFSFL